MGRIGQGVRKERRLQKKIYLFKGKKLTKQIFLENFHWDFISQTLYRFPDAPRHKRKEAIGELKNTKSTETLFRSTYCSKTKKRRLSPGRNTFYLPTESNFSD